jgi:hypothetical protein
MRAEGGDLLSKNGTYSQLFHKEFGRRARWWKGGGRREKEQVFADS